MNEEIWKPVAGFEGRYEVSNRGRVRAIFLSRRKHDPPPRYLKNTPVGGYPRATLYDDSGRMKQINVAVLVARAFIANPKPTQYDEVNHLDGDKTNSNDWNLEWTDHDGNMQHASETGLHHSGERTGTSKLTEEEVLEIIASSMAQRALAKKYGVAQTTISAIKRRENWATPFSFRRTAPPGQTSSPAIGNLSQTTLNF